MTYQEAIARLDHELRDEEAWPSDTSKIDEQINLLYNALLAVARTIPLGRITTLTESDALTGSVAKGTVKRYDLGQGSINPFDLRYAPELGIEDMGIAALRLDSIDYNLFQSVSVPAILGAGDGGVQAGRTLFALDFPNDQIYATNVTDFKLYHVPSPTRPQNTSGNADSYDTLAVPLADQNDLQRVIHIVAAHVSGVTIKDTAGAQFQALLEETYSG